MVYIIVKKTRGESEAARREALAKRGLDPRRYRGTASSAEEAHDTQRALEREGEKFDRLWEVSGDSRDAKQAHEDFSLKQGLNPETGERLSR